MHASLNLIAAAVALAVPCAVAQPVFIVDTGPGPDTRSGLALYNKSRFFQDLGATFRVETATTITGVEGWIGVDCCDDTGLHVGNVRFELRAGARPDGALLFSALVGITDTAPTWRGAKGVNWPVGAGDYTLVLAAQPGFAGMMPNPSPNPLAVEWVRNEFRSAWSNLTTMEIGVRVSAVPEPAIYLQMLFGLLTFSAVVRRRRATGDGAM